jgi:uncharacterized protein (TIGR03437 family)
MGGGPLQLEYNNVQVLRSWLALAVLCVGTARGAAPSYSTAGIVNTPNSTLGPFAPGSVVSIYGTGLGESAEGTALDAGALKLPFELNNAHVYVGGYPAPMLFASESQINFLIPSNMIPGAVTIRVAVDGNTIPSGPEITVQLVDAVPALFPMAGGYAIATHDDGTVLTPDSPAHAWDIVVIYLTGLGRIQLKSAPEDIPTRAWPILQLSDLQVSLGGVVMDPAFVKYAGVTPGSAGLYQINLALPDKLGTDPEIRVAVAGQSSPAGLKLPLR